MRTVLSSQWREIIHRKSATRKLLQELSVKEKIEKLDALRSRLDQIRKFSLKNK